MKARIAVKLEIYLVVIVVNMEFVTQFSVISYKYIFKMILLGKCIQPGLYNLGSKTFLNEGAGFYVFLFYNNRE